MSQHHNIPLIHASVCEPVILAARTIGTPLEKILPSVRLTPRVLDEPFLLVPEIPVWNLVHTISTMEDEPLFGLKATIELATYDIESVKYLTQGCFTLKALLERFCAVAPSVCSSDHYVLEEKGEYAWLVQKGLTLTADYKQVELFTVAGMLQMVQLVAGEDWRPAEIHFTVKHCHHINDSEHLNPGRIFFSKQYAAIAIPRGLLSLAVQTLDEIDDSVSLNSCSDTLENNLMNAITPYIGETRISKQILSDISGISFRSLQRKLEQEGTSYSAVLDQSRFQKAKSLLENTDEKLLNISLMLGYENASTFSRAFKRWAGVTPKEFRKLHH